MIEEQAQWIYFVFQSGHGIYNGIATFSNWYGLTGNWHHDMDVPDKFEKFVCGLDK